MISKYASQCRDERLGAAVAQTLFNLKKQSFDQGKLLSDLGTASNENGMADMAEGLKNPMNAMQAVTGASTLGGGALGYGAAHLMGSGPMGKGVGATVGAGAGAGLSMLLARYLAERERQGHASKRDAAVERMNEMNGIPKSGV